MKNEKYEETRLNKDELSGLRSSDLDLYSVLNISKEVNNQFYRLFHVAHLRISQLGFS